MIYYKGLKCKCYPREIFWAVLYSFQRFLEKKLPLKTVLDIGAHHGSLSLLAAHYGATRVIAVDPVHGETLENNIKSAGFEHIIKLIDAAVSSEGEVAIRHCDDGGMQSIVYKEEIDPRVRLVDRAAKVVRGVKFLGLIEEFEHIDYLKIDAEGGEYNFFALDGETREALRRVRYIDFEIHPMGDGDNMFYDLDSPLIRPEYRERGHERIIEFLKSCGFRSDEDDKLFGFAEDHFKGVNEKFSVSDSSM
jgi:FkbM family methyltransferase